jgi:hypothetical protein
MAAGGLQAEAMEKGFIRVSGVDTDQMLANGNRHLLASWLLSLSAELGHA